MTDHVYRIIDMAGSSEVSHADAIENALARASKTIRHVRWFEVTQMRGDIENGKPRYYQVTLKVGFALEDGSDQASSTTVEFPHPAPHLCLGFDDFQDGKIGGSRRCAGVA